MQLVHYILLNKMKLDLERINFTLMAHGAIIAFDTFSPVQWVLHTLARLYLMYYFHSIGYRCYQGHRFTQFLHVLVQFLHATSVTRH